MTNTPISKSPIVINFKTTGSRAFFEAYFEGLASFYTAEACAHGLILCPPFPYLSLFEKARHELGFTLGAQDCDAVPGGPLTGAVTVAMLQDMGVSHVLVGHSERRVQCGETPALLQQKLTTLVEAGLRPILCVGEDKQTRESGATLAHLKADLLACLPPSFAGELDVAYEPVWAIGASQPPEQGVIDEACQHVSVVLQERHVKSRVFYGGSVTADNAATLLQSSAQGLLVGRAGMELSSLRRILGL